MRCIGFAQTQALVYGLPVRRLWIRSSHREKTARLSRALQDTVRRFLSLLR